MAIAAILGSVLQTVVGRGVQSKLKEFQQELRQVGQDLQTGNLAQAQTDFATLQQNSPLGVPNTTTIAGNSASKISNPIARQFYELGQELKAGNLAAAQQAYGALQQDFQLFTAKGTLPDRISLGA